MYVLRKRLYNLSSVTAVFYRLMSLPLYEWCILFRGYIFWFRIYHLHQIKVLVSKISVINSKNSFQLQMKNHWLIQAQLLLRKTGQIVTLILSRPVFMGTVQRFPMELKNFSCQEEKTSVPEFGETCKFMTGLFERVSLCYPVLQDQEVLSAAHLISMVSCLQL